MKRFFILLPVMAVLLTVVPYFICGAHKNSCNTAQGDNSADLDEDYFTVYLTEQKEAVQISAYNYVCQTVAAEIPILSPDEAIKAQAVAAYTYACNQREAARQNGEQYDITTDSGKNQAFCSWEQLKERWQGNYNKYKSRLCSLVNEVYGEKILYNGKPILAVYHACNGGTTESCATVWGSSVEYLVPVSSQGDTQTDDYISTVSFTEDELREKITAMWEKTIFSENPAQWLGDAEYSASGTVTKISIGSVQLTGAAVRRCLGLRSAAFKAEYSDGGFVFTVYGYGHGVGMSQQGAIEMAKQGATYKEILTHYYTGVEVG